MNEQDWHRRTRTEKRHHRHNPSTRTRPARQTSLLSVKNFTFQQIPETTIQPIQTRTIASRRPPLPQTLTLRNDRYFSPAKQQWRRFRWHPEHAHVLWILRFTWHDRGDHPFGRIVWLCDNSGQEQDCSLLQAQDSTTQKDKKQTPFHDDAVSVSPSWDRTNNLFWWS